MNITKQIFTASLLIAISGCNSTTTVVPQSGKTAIVIANADTPEESVQKATEKANYICNLDVMAVKTLNLETTYLGNDSEQKKLVSLANRVLPESKKSDSDAAYNHRYKTVLTYRCVPTKYTRQQEW